MKETTLTGAAGRTIDGGQEAKALAKVSLSLDRADAVIDGNPGTLIHKGGLRMKKSLTLSSCILLLVVLAAASENERSEEPYKSAVVGSLPNEMIGGVASGGLPWVVSKG